LASFPNFLTTMQNNVRARQPGEDAPLPSLWTRITTPASKWEDKDEFLDVIYYARQILGIILGVLWGLIPMRGAAGLASFALINAGTLYVYSNNFQSVDEEEYGGPFEMAKEGFLTSFAGFLVSWICVYSAVHFD